MSFHARTTMMQTFRPHKLRTTTKGSAQQCSAFRGSGCETLHFRVFCGLIARNDPGSAPWLVLSESVPAMTRRTEHCSARLRSPHDLPQLWCPPSKSVGERLVPVREPGASQGSTDALRIPVFRGRGFGSGEVKLRSCRSPTSRRAAAQGICREWRRNSASQCGGRRSEPSNGGNGRLRHGA